MGPPQASGGQGTRHQDTAETHHHAATEKESRNRENVEP